MEKYRQPIRINNQHVTMLGLASDLTGLVRRYYGNWRRPLAENREDLQSAKQLGDKIVRLASERPWREDALQEVMGALKIQDKEMHHRVSNLLTDARASYQIGQHQEVQSELRDAFCQGETEEIWQVSRKLYRLSHQTLDLFDKNPSRIDNFYSKLEDVKKEDPDIYTRIVVTLNEVSALRAENATKQIPQPRTRVREVDVFRNDRMVAVRLK